MLEAVSNGGSYFSLAVSFLATEVTILLVSCPKGKYFTDSLKSCHLYMAKHVHLILLGKHTNVMAIFCWVDVAKMFKYFLEALTEN
jgi:hypothetical protein